MTISSVTFFKDINNNFVKGTVTLFVSTETQYYKIEGYQNFTKGSLTIVNCTKGVSSVIFSTKSGGDRSGPYIVVPPNLTPVTLPNIVSFDFGITNSIQTNFNPSDFPAFSIGGILATVSSTVDTINIPTLPVTPGGIGDANLTVETQGENGVSIAYNYSDHFDRAIVALEQMSINLNNLAFNQEKISSQLSLIESHLKNYASVVSEGNLPTKDIYSSLAYSTLIKVLEEENVDIDALIQKTQTILRGLE